MSDETNYSPYKSLEALLDDWLAKYPESRTWQDRAEVDAQISRSLERLKAALEKQLGHSLSAPQFKALLLERLGAHTVPSLKQALDEWTKELEQRSNEMTAGLRALAGRLPKRKPRLEAIAFPATASLIFSCEQCDKGFPLEDGVRTFLSMEQAHQCIAEFSKALEPRTIACSCGHKAEYYPEDVALFVLPEK
jgi:hypothetical protein